MGNETRNREKFMASIGRKKPKDLKKKKKKKKKKEKTKMALERQREKKWNRRDEECKE